MGAQQSAPLPVAPLPAPVILHVYDLGHSHEMRTMNSILETVGTGAFHCGVEVYGREWSFQCTPRGTGVFTSVPGRCPSHTWRTTVPMGETLMTSQEVLKLIEYMRLDWTGQSYDMLTRNCCHFSDELCRRLGVGPIPMWTTNLAGAGASLKGAYDVAVENLYPTLLMGCFQQRREEAIQGKQQRAATKDHPGLGRTGKEVTPEAQAAAAYALQRNHQRRHTTM